MVGGGGGIAIIVTSSRLQVTLRVETWVELELSLPESDLEPSLLKTAGLNWLGLSKYSLGVAEFNFIYLYVFVKLL